MDHTDDADAWLQMEFDLLAQACERLRTHPTLGALQEIARLGSGHAELMLYYADQLDTLLGTVSRHATSLHKIASQDDRALDISIAARKAVEEVAATLRPLIQTLRRQAVASLSPEKPDNIAIAPLSPPRKASSVSSWGSSDIAGEQATAQMMTEDLSPSRTLH
jgi:hypothetical protein